MGNSSLGQLTLVRYREFWREPEAVFWSFVFPVLLTAGLGIAFRNRPPEVVKVGVTDRAFVSALERDKSLDVRVFSGTGGADALRMGRILVLVEPGSPTTYRYDDTNPDARTARLLADRALQTAAGAVPAVTTRDQLVREPGSRYIDFLVPGLLAMNFMNSGMWGIGFTIVDARRKKLLKRLVASPMSRAEYLLSFLLSRLSMLAVEVGVLIGFAIWVFGVPVRMPLWEMTVVCLLTALAFSAVGLLIASRAKTLEAASGLMNFVMLPMWIFSGVFFSSERFPAAIQPFVQALPLTAAVDALRGGMLQGARLHQISGELGILTGWLVVCFVAALKLFRWR